MAKHGPPESSLVAAATSAVSATHPVVATHEEVRIAGKRPDLIAILSTGELVSVEMKVHDWKRALQQAASNRVFADYSYVGMWSGAVHLVDVDTARKLGVGIMALEPDGAFEVALPAPTGGACVLTQYGILKKLAE